MSKSMTEAKRLILEFLDAYLLRRDMEGVLACLAHKVQWVGPGKGETAAGHENVKNYLRMDFEDNPFALFYDCDDMVGQELPGGNLMFLFSLRFRREGLLFHARITMTCVQEGGEWKIASLHCSTPEHITEDGDFPAAGDGVNRDVFARSISTRALDLLEKNIAGGILGTYTEPGYPLYYINDRMLNHLGYTREEFERESGGYLLPYIHPEDRGRISRMVGEAIERNEEYEFRYRILKRDGSYIWANDIGRIVLDTDGRSVCIGVVRDITEELEQKRRLEQEAEEKARQALRYDLLFQSVLCGIVQYRIDERGKVVFENANREAMRIFGYEPEEFWAKDDWELPLLVAEEDRERVMKGVGTLQRAGDKGGYEYRLRQKDGRPCWIIGSAEIVLNAEGEEVVQSVFIDIDKRKKAEQRNRLLAEQVEASNELLRLALEHTTTCECYYDPQLARLTLPPRTRAYYSCPGEYANMPESFAEDRVDEEFRAEFCDMFHRIDRGERTAGLEFRVRDSERWCRATFSVLQYSEEGESELAVGVLEDITREKQMEHALEDAHSRDSLTGLYNKEFGVHLVQESLRQRPEEDCYALMLLDMDDFGDINNAEGNAFADALLQEVADILLAAAGEEGVCVRLGGDEFMIMLPHCNKARAAIVGPQIAAQVQGIFVQPEKNLQISVSIGMCVTDVVGEYTALYRCAESTLKYVKEHARGTAACYLDTSNELGVLLTQVYTEEHPMNAIDRASAPREDDLVSFALELLGKSKNLDDAMFLLFSRIGKSLGLDRVTLMDVDHEYLSGRVSYQWAANRTRLELGREHYFTAQELENISNMYDEEGLCEFVLREGYTDIASCLHAGIWNYGEYSGAMSFEIDVENYEWSDKQRKLLKELVKIVNSFMMKVKADAISKAKTDFLSRMSHEIRTPMNAISGMTTIAKSVLGDREKTLDCLEKIESANEYLLELINDVLDMSRIESGKLELNCEPFDLAELLSRLEALLRPQAEEKGLSLRFESGYECGRLLIGDTLRLNQVLINIIGNAIKFTPSGGEVIVRVEQKAAEPRATLSFSVKDTGIGIEPAAMKRIFNAFEQANRHTVTNHGGTGLGLAISGRLVQLMGGQLEVDSTLGKGSEFYFTLSFEYASGELPRKTAPAPAPVLDFTGMRLLVAEDNELNQEIVRTILEMQGCLTVCVDNGAEALAQFMKNEPGFFDAVLMDIRMPIMDGLEATRRIRTSGRPDARSLPIIAITANAFDEDSKKSIESGMNGHLTKPLQIDRLIELLGECLTQDQ